MRVKLKSRKSVILGVIAVTVIMAVAVFSSSNSEATTTKSKSSSSTVTGLKYVDPTNLTINSSSSSNQGGPNTSTYDYSGTLSSTLTASGKTVSKNNKTIKSSTSDKNVVLAKSGGVLKLKNVTLKKSGSDSNGDNCNFYGLNSSVLAVGSKSNVYISKSNITSTSTGSNGIFATDKARIYANSVKITTKSGANSRGLDATYGGVIYGNKLTVSTAKDHCAALATDRGGGYISVTNSTLKTAGSGSPLLYSTGDIEVDNVTGTASGSQIAGMEGLNRILIYNSKLTSTNDAISGSDPIKNGVILYQSTSGDADTSTSSKADFEAVNSTLKTSISSGAMFYVTNTNAKVILQNTKLSFDSDKVDLINASGNSNGWGTSGNNGGKLTFTAIGETLKGNVKTDSISSVNMFLLFKTKYTGSTSGTVNMNISKNSKWVVTGNSTVKNLNVADGGQIVDKDGNTVTIKVNGVTKVKGDSDYTVTVTGSYSTTVTTTSVNQTSKKVVSRAAFDKYYKTSTKFGTNN
ncbi:autotransporter outer membrane beta-barrel domain-containing protein [Aminicella lysinilytica]|uniref:Adhesin n=1 Tax=Aminicella lysinilytica TaxID=433323 RepID=A0A4R6Q1Y3_9FIRM|nr:adhesin [Aminicella lysinilytica]TDP51968.1 hypothetical protein EV211_12827 [Aminicella lysinilytica]